LFGSRIEGSRQRALRGPKVSTRKFSAWKKKKNKNKNKKEKRKK
jgi:hypothetical protein